MNGEAEPRLTSGGVAALKEPLPAAWMELLPAALMELLPAVRRRYYQHSPDPAVKRHSASATNCQRFCHPSHWSKNFDQKRSLFRRFEQKADWHTGCSRARWHFALCAAHSDESRWRETRKPLFLL